MELSDFTTDELNLSMRVCDCLADVASRDTVEGHVLAAAAEVLRSALRSQTRRDRTPGQISLPE